MHLSVVSFSLSSTCEQHKQTHFVLFMNGHVLSVFQFISLVPCFIHFNLIHVSSTSMHRLHSYFVCIPNLSTYICLVSIHKLSVLMSSKCMPSFHAYVVCIHIHIHMFSLPYILCIHDLYIRHCIIYIRACQYLYYVSISSRSCPLS